MRSRALIMLLTACAAPRQSIKEVVSAFDDEAGGIHFVVTHQSVEIGSRWEVIDDQGALGEAVVIDRDPKRFCDDAFCTFWKVQFERRPTRPLPRRAIAIGPIDHPQRQARLMPPPPGVLIAVDLDGDGRVNLDTSEVPGGDDEACFQLRERGEADAGWRPIWRRCQPRHY